MKKINRAAALLLAAIMTLPVSAVSAYADGSAAYAGGTFMPPNVTEEMCSADFWQKKSNASDEVVMNGQEIEKFNRSVLDTSETFTNDLKELDPTFDGRSMADSMAAFESPSGLYLNGKAADEEYFEKIRENIKNADVSDNMQLGYGVAVNRTVMKAYPYDDFLSDNPEDPEWDELASVGVCPNEPLVVYFATADGRFTLAKNSCCSGWVPTEDIALCSDKDEWLAVTSPENFVVVTGEKVYLESSADTDLSQKMLPMGTRLELVDTFPGPVAFRLPWNSYVVKMPVREDDGSLSQKLAMIPSNRDVSAGYLTYTTKNVISQAFKLLGNRYGWGGMLDSQDCSLFVRDVYRCFGLELPRNTTWQAAMPAEKIDMSGMTVSEKTDVLNTLPSGSVLQFSGHEMLYLGEEGGLYYTINDVSSLVSPDDPDGGIIDPRSVIVNDLSTLRANGTTWLDNLNCAIVVHAPEDKTDDNTEENKSGSVTIFHTNDMHGNLIGSDSIIGADKIAALKKQYANSILADGGDAAQGVALATLSKGEAVIELMNSAGYDVMAAGNHEFDNGADQLKKLMGMANFPIISANTYSEGKPFFETEDSNGQNVIIEKNGIKVGFFALTTVNTSTSANANAGGGVRIDFTDELEAAKEQTELLDQEGADVIIAITHLGILQNEAGHTSYDIAREMAGTELDAIIDGHSHSVVNEKVGDILVAQTGTGSTLVGKMDIVLDENGNADISETQLSAEDLKDIAPDPDVSAKIDEISSEQSELLSQVVGETNTTLWGGSINQIAEARVGETNFGSLIADSIIYSAKSIIGDDLKDLPVVSAENGGGFRSAIPNGKITMGSIINALPFANTVTYKIISPSVLYDLLEGSVSSVSSQDNQTGFMNASYSGSFLQIGGMRFEYDPNGESGSKVKAVYLDSESEPLDRNDTESRIILASNDYVIGSGILADIPISGEGGGLMEAVSDYIAYLTENGSKPLDLPVTSGRIRTVGEYVPTDYTANVRIKNADDSLPESGTEIEFFVDSVRTKATVGSDGVLSFTVSDGPHGIKLYEDQAEVYVNNYSGAGVIESFDAWNGGFPQLVLMGEKPSDDTTEPTTTTAAAEESKPDETTTKAAAGYTGKSSGKGSRSSSRLTTVTERSTEQTTAETDEKPTESTTDALVISAKISLRPGDNVISIGDKTYTIDAAPYIQTASSSVMVPLRFAAVALMGDDPEAADASSLIGWDPETKTAFIYVGNKTISFTSESYEMTVDGRTSVMENGVKAEIKDGRIYIPFRALGSALGVKTDWDGETKTASYSVTAS